MSFALFTDSSANLTEAEYTANRVEVVSLMLNINDEKERYLEELLMTNNDKENLINSINELQDRLNRKETENYQNQLEISKLKKDNRELMELLEDETSN